MPPETLMHLWDMWVTERSYKVRAIPLPSSSTQLLYSIRPLIVQQNREGLTRTWALVRDRLDHLDGAVLLTQLGARFLFFGGVSLMSESIGSTEETYCILVDYWYCHCHWSIAKTSSIPNGGHFLGCWYPALSAGATKIFFRAALAILQLSEQYLLELDLESIMLYLNSFPHPGVLEPEVLIPTALAMKVGGSVLKGK
ncbi:unnamed protein product [Discosporangium mesarthrocarpum]